MVEQKCVQKFLIICKNKCSSAPNLVTAELPLVLELPFNSSNYVLFDSIDPENTYRNTS